MNKFQESLEKQERLNWGIERSKTYGVSSLHEVGAKAVIIKSRENGDILDICVDKPTWLEVFLAEQIFQFGNAREIIVISKFGDQLGVNYAEFGRRSKKYQKLVLNRAFDSLLKY